MTARTEIEVEFPLICGCARKLAKQPLGDSRLGRVERSHRDFKNREAVVVSNFPPLPVERSHRDFKNREAVDSLANLQRDDLAQSPRLQES